MNAAARLVHQNILSRQLVLTQLLTRRQLTLLMLTLAILLTGLGVIYVTNTTRVLYASYQRNLIEQDRLHVTRGQLLLERSTWMMQARIQQIAEKKLGMHLPDHQSVVIMHE